MPDVKQVLLAEFDVEMATTRPFLERVPLDRADFAPHPRSTKLGQLATHIARLVRFTGISLGTDELDFATADRSQWGPIETKEELMATFDSNVATSRAALERATAQQLEGTWTLRAGEHVFFSEPRWMVQMRFMANHVVHHRAQLGVYLRMLDVPVPNAYGPTADEG